MYDLDEYIVKQAPAVIFYIPNFISNEEEEKLWNHIYSAPKPKWTTLSNRRLQNWGGFPHSKGMVPDAIPQWLSDYTKRVTSLGIFGEKREANHVLINEYTAGQGIMAHVDGPLFYPTISTLNIGGHILLNLYSLAEEESADSVTPNKPLTDRFLGSLLLEPRSLLILQQRAYTHVLHDISDIELDLVTQHRVLNWEQTTLGKCVDKLFEAAHVRSTKDLSGSRDLFEGREQAAEMFCNHPWIHCFFQSICCPNVNFEKQIELNNIIIQRRYSKEMVLSGCGKLSNSIVDDCKTSGTVNCPLCRKFVDGDLNLNDLNEISQSLSGCGTAQGNQIVVPIHMCRQQFVALRRGTRISLTIRYVPKVVKTKIFLNKRF